MISIIFIDEQYPSVLTLKFNSFENKQSTDVLSFCFDILVRNVLRNKNLLDTLSSHCLSSII